MCQNSNQSSHLPFTGPPWFSLVSITRWMFQVVQFLKEITDMILFFLPYNRNSQCFHGQTDEYHSRWWVRYLQVPQCCVGCWCWGSLGKQTGIFQLWCWLQVILTFLYPLQPLPVWEEKNRVSKVSHRRQCIMSAIIHILPGYLENAVKWEE